VRGRPAGDRHGDAGRGPAYADEPETSYPDEIGPDRGDGPVAGVARQILDRFLDGGLVIDGEVDIALPGIGPLTLKPRLVIAPADTARRPGARWKREGAATSPARSKPGRDDRSTFVRPEPQRPEPESRAGRRSVDPATEFVGDHPIYREEDGP